MTRQPFGGSEPLDLEAIRQSPRQFVDLTTVEKLSDYAMVCELKIEILKREIEALRPNSERYQFLRGDIGCRAELSFATLHTKLSPTPMLGANIGWEELESDDLDAAIDAAMKGQ